MVDRILGQGLEVSTIGLGCMGLSQSYPPFPDKKEGITFLRRGGLWAGVGSPRHRCVTLPDGSGGLGEEEHMKRKEFLR